MKSLILHAEEVRAVLERGTVQVRRPVPEIILRPEWGPLRMNVDGELFQEHPSGQAMAVYRSGTGRRVKCPWFEDESHFVRETFSDEYVRDGLIAYKADYPQKRDSEEGIVHMKVSDFKWRSSSQMPQEFSRLTLEPANVRVQQLGQMTEQDVLSCGLIKNSKDNGRTWKHGIADRDGWPGFPGSGDIGWVWQDWEVDPQKAYAKHWNNKYAKKDLIWFPELWTWVGEFKRVEVSE